jgi:hypothetical protein
LCSVGPRGPDRLDKPNPLSHARWVKAGSRLDVQGHCPVSVNAAQE